VISAEREVICGLLRSKWDPTPCAWLISSGLALLRKRLLRKKDAPGRDRPQTISMTAELRALEDTRWGTACLAYNVQIDLTDPVARALAAAQQQLLRILHVPLYLVPVSSLHVSVYALAPVHWDSPDKEAYFSSIAERSLGVLRQTCDRAPRFLLRFHQLRATPHAVIAVASDSTGRLASLREALRAVADPAVPTPRYDLVHTTIARFASSESVPSTSVREVEALPIDVSLEVRHIRIVRERTYPSLSIDEVARVGLAEP
jgi:hypothetical protein